jgi:hypothetical protein
MPCQTTIKPLDTEDKVNVLKRLIFFTVMVSIITEKIYTLRTNVFD